MPSAKSRTPSTDTPVETVIRGNEGAIRLAETGLAAEPLAGLNHPRRDIPHLDFGAEHMRDFIRCVRTRDKPQGDIELAYYLQAVLTMAMQSYVENKVATFDAATEQIHLENRGQTPFFAGTKSLVCHTAARRKRAVCPRFSPGPACATGC